MQTALKALMGILPLVFGLGFLAPVIAQGMTATGIDAPFGMTSLSFGLAIGGIWGLVASVRQRWI